MCDECEVWVCVLILLQVEECQPKRVECSSCKTSCWCVKCVCVGGGGGCDTLTVSKMIVLYSYILILNIPQFQVWGRVPPSYRWVHRGWADLYWPLTPVDCETLRTWMNKCSDDSETANYILANTKDVSLTHHTSHTSIYIPYHILTL